MIDYDSQRRAMVESQLRPNEVTDARLLAAMRTMPRERFVPQRLSGLAYMDEPIEIFPAIDGALPRYLLAPMILARLIQLAAIGPEDSVLDVGCATGYSTAILAGLGRFVTGVEPEPELAKAARSALHALGIENAEIVEAPLVEGYRAQAPYDVIFLNGSVQRVPQSLIAQLKDGGRLAVVLSAANAGAQGRAYLFVKVAGEASGLPQFDAGAKPLPGFSPEPSFHF